MDSPLLANQSPICDSLSCIITGIEPSAAGPISNLVLAVISSVLLFLVARFNPVLLQTNPTLLSIFYLLILMNILLAVFNLLPIPPLDGSRVADALMPRKWRPQWQQFLQLGPILLVAVIALPFLTGIRIFAWPMEKATLLVNWLLAPAGIAM